MSSESLPPGYFAGGDKSGSIVAAGASMIALATLAVILRVASRLLSKKAGFWWDDWLAMTAWVFLMPNVALIIYLKWLGMGRHIGHVTAAQIDEIQKVIYVSEIFYNLSLTCSKLSALAFFVRVFSWTRAWFKAYSLVTGLLCVGWCIAITFLGCFQCDPPYRVWKPKTPGTCLSAHDIYLGTVIPNVMIDLFILILPLPLISTLKASKMQRGFLMAVFALGYCVLALSVARLVIIIQATDAQLKDLTWNFVSTIILAILESGIALISVCIPSHLYLAKRMGKYLVKIWTSASWSSKSLKGDDGAHLGAVGDPIDPGHSNNNAYQPIHLDDLNRA